MVTYAAVIGIAVAAVGVSLLLTLFVAFKLDAAAKSVVAQVNERLSAINDRFTRQTRVNLILADRIGELSRKDGKVLPLRKPEGQ